MIGTVHHIGRRYHGVVLGRITRRGRCACEPQRQGCRYTEEAYALQQQSMQRAEWAEGVRVATTDQETQRVKHQFWEPKLDPPPLLQDVAVVLVSPRRPVSVGTVARVLSCFECSSLAIVAPRCDWLQRNSKSASKGAQYLLHRVRTYENVQEAICDAEFSVAFTRWSEGRSGFFLDLHSLSSHPAIVKILQAPIQASPSTSARRVALVFGREELGLSDDEVDACSAVCSIPIGRLQESLSLSHACTLALSSLYSSRLSYLANRDTA